MKELFVQKIAKSFRDLNLTCNKKIMQGCIIKKVPSHGTADPKFEGRKYKYIYLRVFFFREA